MNAALPVGLAIAEVFLKDSESANLKATHTAPLITFGSPRMRPHGHSSLARYYARKGYEHIELAPSDGQTLDVANIQSVIYQAVHRAGKRATLISWGRFNDLSQQLALAKPYLFERLIAVGSDGRMALADLRTHEIEYWSIISIQDLPRALGDEVVGGENHTHIVPVESNRLDLGFNVQVFDSLDRILAA
jgi:hypothetical protein